MTRSSFSEKYNRLCFLLIEARKVAGYTQVQLAEKLLRPQSFVSKYERGERRLDVVEFLEVVQALNIDIYKFLSRLNTP